MIIGPIFARELVTTPRRPRHFMVRTIYVLALLTLMATAWLLLNGTQKVRNIGDMAQFGTILFQILAPLQLTLMTFMSALVAASAVAQEKDRRTLILMLLTRINNSELVLGKLFASLLDVFSMLLASLPLFLLITLFGGVSYEQVGRVFLVTAATALAAGSLGSTLALSREKTFQTLAMTALTLVLWLGVWEAVHAGLLFREWRGISCESLATMFSPMRAIFAAARPVPVSAAGLLFARDAVAASILVALGIAGLLNLLAIWRVRVWNPSRDIHPGQQENEGSIWGTDHEGAKPITAAEQDEQARAGHVDARRRTASTKSRRVWDNPVLWREVCTSAYGRKVLIIRLAYLLFFAMAWLSIHSLIVSGEATRHHDDSNLIPAAAKPLAPFLLVSLVIVNALAVTSITNERDGQALDLLLVTDLSPKEFIFGKIGGVLWVTSLMIVLPMFLCGFLWWRGGMSFENFIYVLLGMGVLNVFATMLGIHCGMNYSNSRSAIGVSLGTVFFLFLGVATCMVIMISFSGSFETQMIPFSFVILGGAIALYVALGLRNPSPAIALASLLLPAISFHAITSFTLQQYLGVFLVTAAAYGFTTAAMMVPAVAEFDIAFGRTKGGGEE